MLSGRASAGGAANVRFSATADIVRSKMLVEDAEPSVIVTDVQNRNLAAELGHPGCRILEF